MGDEQQPPHVYYVDIKYLEKELSIRLGGQYEVNMLERWWGLPTKEERVK